MVERIETVSGWGVGRGAVSVAKSANGIKTRRIARNFAQLNLTTAKPLGGGAGDARGVICDAGDVTSKV